MSKDNGDDGFVIGNAPEIATYTQKGRDYASVWASPEAFYRHVNKLSESKAWHKAGWEKESGGKDDYGRFYGTPDMEAAVKLAELGWKEGAEKIERLRGYILAMNPKAPTNIKYGIAGQVPSVPRAVSGNPLNMKQLETGKSRKKPIITIMYDMAQSCMISPETLTNKAATVAALVDVIESRGYCCEVLATATSTNRKFEAVTTIMVKPSHQSVDTVKLGFALGHASMFRRFVFADWGGQKEAEKLGWGLGYTSQLNESDEKHFKEKYIYNITKATSEFKDEKTCAEKGVNAIIRDLQAQKCPPFLDWKDPDPPKKGDKKRNKYLELPDPEDW